MPSKECEDVNLEKSGQIKKNLDKSGHDWTCLDMFEQAKMHEASISCHQKRMQRRWYGWCLFTFLKDIKSAVCFGKCCKWGC